MPDERKRLQKIEVTFTLQGLNHVHKHYMMGFNWAILTEDEIRKANEMIEGLEKILVLSGYMTELEVKVRHQRLIASNPLLAGSA